MTTVQAAAARRVSCQLDTLWDFDGEPTHHELESVPISRLERLGQHRSAGRAAVPGDRPPRLSGRRRWAPASGSSSSS